MTAAAARRGRGGRACGQPGHAMSHRVDPTLWLQKGWPTLADPTSASLAKLRNHHIYAMKVSKEFYSGLGPPTSLKVGGAWHRFISTASDAAAREEMRQACRASRLRSLPMRTNQVLHRTLLACMPTSVRMGGDGRCPTCAAQGYNCNETPEHRAVGCPLAALVMRACLSEWIQFTGENWPAPVMQAADIRPGYALPPFRAVRRAWILGLPPPGGGACPELFTMIRGFALQETARIRDAAAQHRPPDPTPRAADLYRAAIHVYKAVQRELTTALEGEFEACKLLERRMRGAGLDIPANSPTAKWHAAWTDSGICTVLHSGRVQQHVLGDAPLMVTVTAATAAGRDPPRPDWAPPVNLPQHTVTVYLNGRARRAQGSSSVWSAVGVVGGDGIHDEAAHLAFEAGAPTEATGLASIAQEALHNAQRLTQVGAAIHVRAPPWMATILAGLDGGASYGPIAREWETTRATRAGWLTRAAPYDNLPWADRALTIAELCAPGKAWGAAGPAYAMGPWASPPVSTVCAICIDDYDDVLPATGMLAPTAAGHFACTHALCRACDLRVQRSQNTKCPMCRAPRLHWVPARP